MSGLSSALNRRFLEETAYYTVLMMNQRSPCSTCPFRSDIRFHLSAEKVKSILAGLQGDSDFPCHNTTTATGKSTGQARACIGAAIFLEHVRPGGLRANLAFRLRESCLQEFHRDELAIDSPVFTDVKTFVAARTSTPYH
jgi:hypothetical protein